MSKSVENINIPDPDGETYQERERVMEESAREMAERAKLKQFETPEGINVGIETEFPVVDNDGETVSSIQRDILVDSLENVETEVGASHIEIATEPVKGLESIEEIFEVLENEERVLREEADKNGLNLIRYGTVPAENLESIERSDEEKYQKVPETYEKLRNPEVQDVFGSKDTIDPRNADLAGILCSTQLNLQAESIEQGLELAKEGYKVSPFIAAVSGNSRFIGDRDLGFDDTRMQLWKISHDDRDDFGEEPGVGQIDSYWDDFDDYIERICDRPTVLNSEKYEDFALDIGQGMYWKDARMKLAEGGELSDELLVEYRIPSTQFTPEEETAVHAFYLGRVLYGIEEDEMEEGGLDIDKVNRNRSSAMHNGLDEKLYCSTGELMDADEAVRYELMKAEEGLRKSGIEDPGYLDILYDRVDQKETPSDRVVKDIGDMGEEIDTREALLKSVENQMEREYR